MGLHGRRKPAGESQSSKDGTRASEGNFFPLVIRTMRSFVAADTSMAEFIVTVFHLRGAVQHCHRNSRLKSAHPASLKAIFSRQRQMDGTKGSKIVCPPLDKGRPYEQCRRKASRHSYCGG
jgi:hypothetical protein